MISRNAYVLSSASIAAIMLCHVPMAQAQTRYFDVAAQPASTGVRLFAKQAGIQIIASSETVDGRSVNRVRGDFDTRAALDRLLSGTGLIIRSFDGKVAILAVNGNAEGAGPETAIIVTGSRIARPELESAMPVSVVRMEQAERLGLVTAYDALVREPAIGVGIGRGNAQSSMDGGTASINLRNLGTNRTLTLIDGRRRVSGSARSSAVDLNLIPAGMIDRIEVITGGAAAIYGADAVTGAVNIITKHDVEGFEVTATQGISQRGDAANFAASFSGGGKFADGRGSVSIGGTYVSSDGLTTYDRDFGRTRLNYVANPANTGLNDGIPDRIIAYDFGEFYYQFYPTFVIDNVNYGYQNGSVRELYVKTPVNNKGEYYGGDGGGVSDIRNLNEGNQIRAPLEQFAITTRFNYELTDTIESMMRFDYGRTRYKGTLTYYREDSRSNFMNGAGSPWAYLDNPYLPDSVRQVMLDNDLTRLRISRAYKEFGIFRDVQERDSYTISETLMGKLGGALKWEAFFQYGRTKNDSTYPDFLRASRWTTARDVIADPVTGQPVCRDEAARAAGCVPYNIFSTAAPTEAQRDWLFTDRRESRTNTQQMFGGNIVGPIYALPYGDIQIALGAEHRRETIRTVDDPLSTTGELSHGFLLSKHPDISASFKVSEVFGELVVPILRDLPFAHRLELEGAYRYSHYDTVGGTHAWKIGGTWAPVPGLTLRGVRSRSVRTPNFGELYEPININQSNLADPCEDPFFYANETRSANCRALGITTPPTNSLSLTEVTAGGNPDLQPETSNSLTLGAVFQPAFLRGFDLTLDYWDINIDDVITQFSANTILNYCVDLPTLDNVFCRQITRDENDPIRSVTALSTQTLNASRLEARGIDLGANFQTPLWKGMLNIGVKATYLLKKELQAVPGMEASIVKQMGSYSDPRFRGSITVAYSQGALDLAVNSRMLGASLYDPNAISDEYNDEDEIPAIVYTDFSIGYQFGEGLRLTAGINNILDIEPPYLQGTYLGAGGIYDVVGRNFFVSAKTRF